jgi:hypothetical protein
VGVLLHEAQRGRVAAPMLGVGGVVGPIHVLPLAAQVAQRQQGQGARGVQQAGVFVLVQSVGLARQRPGG